MSACNEIHQFLQFFYKNQNSRFVTLRFGVRLHCGVVGHFCQQCTSHTICLQCTRHWMCVTIIYACAFYGHFVCIYICMHILFTRMPLIHFWTPQKRVNRLCRGRRGIECNYKTSEKSFIHLNACLRDLLSLTLSEDHSFFSASLYWKSHRSHTWCT